MKRERLINSQPRLSRALVNMPWVFLVHMGVSLFTGKESSVSTVSRIILAHIHFARYQISAFLRNFGNRFTRP